MSPRGSVLGDLDGDGFDDIAAGAYRSDWGAFDNAGKTYIYYGGSPPDFSADHVLVGEADGERFGYARAASEIDTSPGYDLAVGAYSYDDTVLNQGRIYLFSGGSSADSLADLTITGSGAGEKYGWSLATGVLNRDSWADLIMGSDGISVDTFATGQMLVFYGGASLDTQSDDQYWLNRPENDYLGYSVTSGFDISGDCCDDILVGMPGNDDKATDAGGAVLLRGDTVIAVDTTVYGDDMLEEAGSAVGGWPHYKGAPAFAIGAPAYNGFQGRLMIFRGEATSVNQPPQLTVPADTSIDVGHVLLFDVTATDPDGTVPALDAADLPGTADFVDNGDGSGTFTWNPQSSDVGLHEIVFTATDTELTDSGIVTIVVTDTGNCCTVRGNINYDSENNVDSPDVIYLVNALFLGGPEIPCPETANVNGDANGDIDLSDVIYLVNSLFLGGPSPPPCP
jgi:hypothetical protein